MASTEGAVLSVLEADQVDPAIARLLQPGEQVYWQGRYTPRRLGASSSLIMLGAVAAAAWWWFSHTGELQPILAQLEQSPGPRNALLVLLVVMVVGPLLINGKPQWLYAITSERLLVLRNGRVLEQPRPADIVILGLRPFGWIHWRYADTGGRNEVRVTRGRATSGLRCGPEDNPQSVLALLRDWQERPNREAQANSEEYRQRAEAAQEELGGVGDIPAENRAAAMATGTVSLQNRQLGFAVDLPSPWQTQVEQRFDGPLRVLGITLLPRIIREGKKRPYQAGDPQPWNCLTSRGGPGVGVDFNVQRERPMPTAETVANEAWARLLGVKVFHVDEDIHIGNFSGFAVVRRIPAGADLAGFGMLPMEVYLRQWWLQGAGLCFEIQGVAPTDAPVLQDTVDLIVKSLRRA